MPLVFDGELLSIHIAEAASVEMETLAEAELIAGVGIAGDRYATAKGTYSNKPHADRQVTLIEEETLTALKRDHGIDLAPEETRRNLLVRDVPLNHLVGRQFRVGSVLLFGGRLNVPCAYLDELLGKPLFGPLTNRSGLNCRILEGGVIRPGDRIVLA
jgi:MOSC domain-containing protein YiiM